MPFTAHENEGTYRTKKPQAKSAEHEDLDHYQAELMFTEMHHLHLTTSYDFPLFL